MKLADVPQDPGSCYGDQRRLTYAVDADGHYVGVPTVGWEAEIDTTNVAVEAANEQIQAAWEAAREGRLSPLAYHLQVARMEPGQLATESGVWGWRIRRHLRPRHFARVSDALLARYADALGLPLDELRALPAAPELL